MSRLNTTGGAHSSGVGQFYAGAGLLGNGTNPWTLSFQYKRSAWDSANKSWYIGIGDSGDSSQGYINLYEQTSNQRVMLFFYDPSSGYNRFRFEYALSLSQFGTAISQPATTTTNHFAIRFGSGTSATNHTSTVPAVFVNGVRIGLKDSYFGASTGLPTCKDQVLFASDSGSNAFEGRVSELGIWDGRALDDDEIKALAKYFTPDHFERGLTLYNSQVRNITQPEIMPAGVTSVADTYGSADPFSPPIIPRSFPQIFPAAFPAVSLSIPTVDADTVTGVGLLSGELVALPAVDADTVTGVGLVTGYASPMVGIRNVLSTTIEALTPPEDFDRAYVRAPTFSIPDGVAGFRMFTVTVGGASSIRAVGPNTHQVEHDFEIRVRISTGVESLEYQFSDLTNEAMKLMNAINNQNLSTVSGADFVECEGFETEEAESEDTDLILICRAMTQEAT